MRRYLVVLFFLILSLSLILSCASRTPTTALPQMTSPPPTPLPLQAGGGLMRVTVLDETGASLPGVLVTLTGALGKRTMTTDADGRSFFGQIPPADYDVRADLQGFTTIEQSDVRIKGGYTTEVAVKMKPGYEELVMVTSEAPVVDVRSTTAGLTISADPHPKRSARRPKSASREPLAAEVSLPTRAYAMAAQIPDSGVGNIGSFGSSDELIIVAQNDEWANSPASPEDREPGKLEARNAAGKTIGEFPLRHTEVQAEIGGYLARTLVQQEYVNPYQQVIEAVYVFPLPSMAAVNDFVMDANGHRIIGIVRPREEAEAIYRSAREQGMTASLLTQERDNIFTQNIANIEPGGTVIIRITYVERLVYENGHYEYVFPMVVGTRYVSGNPVSIQGKDPAGGIFAATDRVPDADRISPPVLMPGQTSVHDMSLSIFLDAGMPIRSLQSHTHKIIVEDNGYNKRTVRLAGENSKTDSDFVLRWSVAGDATQFGVLAHRNTQDGFFTLMMQPPLEPADSQVSPREITLIMDVSGSMRGLPLETSRELVQKALDRIRPEDRFNIVYFSGSNGQLWDDPQPPLQENIEAARKFLSELQGGGGTEMMAGLQRALAANHDPRFLQMYVFLTDGYVGEDKAILKVIRENKGQARFFALGIGSAVNRYLIDGIAELGSGFAQMVIPQNRQQAGRALNRFFAAIDSPVLVDLQIDWNGIPVKDVYPKHLPDLFAGQTISVVGRYEDAAGGTIYVNGRIGATTVRYEVPLQLQAQEISNEALGCLWARQRIHELNIALWKSKPEKKQELISKITDLAMKYRIVSDFTAFIAVDESRVIGDGKPLKILQPVEIPAGTTAGAVLSSAEITAWGMKLQMEKDGKVTVADVDHAGVAAQSGIKKGAVLDAVNKISVHDMMQLESLLLQASTDTVNMDFQEGGSVILPRP